MSPFLIIAIASGANMDTRYVESSLLESMHEDKKKVIERTHEVLSNADIAVVSVRFTTL